MSLLRSVGAVLAGAITAIILAISTDFGLTWAGVFPGFEGGAAFTAPMLLIALAYRTGYGVLGAFITAKLAPNHPWRHVWILAVLGLIASIAGAVTMRDAGNEWYAWGLVVLALPTAWLGGFVWEKRARRGNVP